MKKVAIGFILGAILTLSTREIYNAFLRPENQPPPLPAIEKTRDRETAVPSTRKRAVIRRPSTRDVAEAPTKPAPVWSKKQNQPKSTNERI